MVGLEEANKDGNIEALANILFSRYVFAFEVTSALLITAAVGAMVLAHRERLTPKPTQADLAAQRVRDYAETGLHLGPLPPPGVFARHNAVDTPALLPDGTRRRGVGLPGAGRPRHGALGAARRRGGAALDRLRARRDAGRGGRADARRPARARSRPSSGPDTSPGRR